MKKYKKLRHHSQYFSCSPWCSSFYVLLQCLLLHSSLTGFWCPLIEVMFFFYCVICLLLLFLFLSITLSFFLFLTLIGKPLFLYISLLMCHQSMSFSPHIQIFHCFVFFFSFHLLISSSEYLSFSSSLLLIIAITSKAFVMWWSSSF